MLVGNISTGNLSIAANAALTMQNREADSSCENETAVMPTDGAMIMSKAGITEASETYGKTGKTTESDNSKKWINPQMKKETEDIMEKYYRGALSRGEVKHIFEQYFYERYGRDISQWEEPKSAIAKNWVSGYIADTYEYFSQANAFGAWLQNYEEATAILGNGNQIGTYYYYNSYWYYEWDEMQELFRETANELAIKYGSDPVNFDEVEKNTRFRPGGITFHTFYYTHSHWSETRLSFKDVNMVPPKNFVYYGFYRQGEDIAGLAKKITERVKSVAAHGEGESAVGDVHAFLQNMNIEWRSGAVQFWSLSGTKAMHSQINTTKVKVESEELNESHKLELFKQEIWKEIDRMPWNGSISESIQITEGAFKRMMEEPEFKEKMMSILRQDALAGRPPISHGITMIDENGYSGYSYNFGYGKEAFEAHSKDKDSFYVRRATYEMDYEGLWEEEWRARQEQREERWEEYEEALSKRRTLYRKRLVDSLYR